MSRVLILGAGAIGCFLGARLALAGHKVVLVGRPPLVEAVGAAGGLILLDPSGDRQFAAGVVAAPTVSAARAGYGEWDLALLTVKAYDTAQAALESAAAVGSTTSRPQGPNPILTLQNGVGNEEILVETFGADAVIAGAIETPVSVPALGQVQVHRARYTIGLAPVGPAAPDALAASALAAAGFAVQQYGDYRSLKWTKLLMNLPANAACAILDWSPAQLMAHPDLSRLEARAWQETLAVMSAQGIRPVSLAGYPIGLLAPLARRLPERLLALGLRRIVSGGRGTKLPSLQLALRAGGRSEVAWLNGSVVLHGSQPSVPTPVNAAYTRILTSITDGRTPWLDFRDHPERLLAECNTISSSLEP